MTRMRRSAERAGAVFAFLLSAFPGSGAAAGEPRHSGNAYQESVRVVDRPWERIGVTVTVTDRDGKPVRGLGCDEFRLLENGAPVDLAECGAEEGRSERPLSVAVLLDLSQSMGSQVRKVEEAARALLAQMRPGDEILVAKFSDQVTVLQPFTGEGDELTRGLKSIGRARGGTALFQSIASTLKDVRSRRGRKIILVVSDGNDNALERAGHVTQSLYMQDLLRLCLRTQTVVYGIRPGMPSSWQSFEDFVQATGGRMLYTGGDLERLFARLGEEFRSQYYLAWDIDPKDVAPGWRRLRVSLARPDLTVHAIDGYFTPRARLESLLHDLDDREEGMRQDAAYDLGFIDDPRARLALRAALEDRDAGVRRLALEGLARLREGEVLPEAIAALADGTAEVRDAAAEALAVFGGEAIDPLCAAVAAGADKRRPKPALLGAAAVLGSIGDDRAIEPLMALLRSPAPAARLAAARALRALGLAGGLAPLREALQDPAPEVRQAAAEGLAGLAGAAARPVLEARLQAETDATVKAALLQLLRQP